MRAFAVFLCSFLIEFMAKNSIANDKQENLD